MMKRAEFAQYASGKFVLIGHYVTIRPRRDACARASAAAAR